jgi:hypothetical protein
MLGSMSSSQATYNGSYYLPVLSGVTWVTTDDKGLGIESKISYILERK